MKIKFNRNLFVVCLGSWHTANSLFAVCLGSGHTAKTLFAVCPGSGHTANGRPTLSRNGSRPGPLHTHFFAVCPWHTANRHSPVVLDPMLEGFIWFGQTKKAFAYIFTIAVSLSISNVLPSMRQEMTDTSSRFHQRRAQFVLKESNLIKFDQQ